MTFALPKITRVLWQIRISLIIAVIYFVIVAFWRFSPTVLLPTTIAMAFGSVFVLVYISFYLKRYTVYADNSGIYIKKGIIFKTIVIIPYPRLAFIKSFTTPVTAGLHIKSIILKVSRGLIFIPELEKNSAERLIEMMRNE